MTLVIQPTLTRFDKAGTEDYALDRVPGEERFPWVTVAMQRFGQITSLSQFVIGASIGMAMPLKDAIIAVAIAAILLEVLALLMGIIGMREGMSTSLLSRWCGFGTFGSALVGLVIAISLTGWFGFQNEIFSTEMAQFFPGIPPWVIAIIAGALVTGFVWRGFETMAWVAIISVPAFILLSALPITNALMNPSAHGGGHQPQTLSMSLVEAISLLFGGFVVGAVMTPDLTRFNFSIADVAKQTVVSIFVGELGTTVFGVLLAHALRSSDVLPAVTSKMVTLAAPILLISLIKINDWNLYSASLGVVNAVDCFFSRRLGRATITIVVGTAGTALSAFGIMSSFQDFLLIVGAVTPPIAGVIIAEYFIVGSWRIWLDENPYDLPVHAPKIVPATLVSWIVGAGIGIYTKEQHWGVPAINSLIAALLVYVLLGLLKLTHLSLGSSYTPRYGLIQTRKSRRRPFGLAKSVNA